MRLAIATITSVVERILGGDLTWMEMNSTATSIGLQNEMLAAEFPCRISDLKIQTPQSVCALYAVHLEAMISVNCWFFKGRSIRCLGRRSW